MRIFLLLGFAFEALADPFENWLVAGVRIPIHAGHLFRDEAGHHSDLIPATVPR